MNNGLKITEIQPGSPQRATGLFDRLNEPTPIPPRSTPAPTIMSPESEVEATPTLEKTGFFDKVLFGLTGPADADLSPQKLAARNSRRRNAGDSAASSASNPAAASRQFMGARSGGGGSGLESLGKIVRLLGGIGS